MLNIKVKQLLDGVTGAAQFMSERKVNRPNLQGITFQVGGGKLELASTDTYTLGICDLGEYVSNDIYYVFINDTKVKDMLKVLKDIKREDINLHVLDSVVRVIDPRTGDILFNADTDIKQFPKYREVLPTYLEDRAGVTELHITPSRLAKLSKVPCNSKDTKDSVFKIKLNGSTHSPIEFTRVDDYGQNCVNHWRVYVMPNVDPDRK